MVEVAVACTRARCSYSLSAGEKGKTMWVQVGECGLVGIRICEL